MRLLLLPASVLLLAGCGLFGEDRVREGTFQVVTVEALPLDTPWDRAPPDTDPDVYVFISDYEGGFTEAPPFRSAVAEDVRRASLPLTLFTAERRPIAVDNQFQITVLDRDRGTFLDSDDVMFKVEGLRLASLLRPEDRPGTGRTLTFEDGATRLLVRVEWR